MKKSQERLNIVRDGQEELGMEGMDPATWWGFGKCQELAAPPTGVLKGEMGSAKMEHPARRASERGGS